jgi:uncharacterized membrane protein
VIEVHDNPENPGFVIIDARANLSMSLERLATVFLGLSAVTLLVALGPLILGLWPILVIALVHLLIVGWCFRLAWRGNWARERLVVGPETLVVEHYALHDQSRKSWPVAWVQVQTDDCFAGDQRIFLACQGQRQQIGAFLPVSERLELAQALKESLRPLTAWSAENKPQVS